MLSGTGKWFVLKYFFLLYDAFVVVRFILTFTYKNTKPDQKIKS